MTLELVFCHEDELNALQPKNLIMIKIIYLFDIYYYLNHQETVTKRYSMSAI